MSFRFVGGEYVFYCDNCNTDITNNTNRVYNGMGSYCNAICLSQDMVNKLERLK